MPSRRICLILLVGTSAILCSCSRNDRSQQKTSDETSGPSVAPSAAPGVAFNYSYDFSLPDKRISAAQEAQAAACEKLGTASCRITGMSYNVDQDEQVSAELDLKLDPSIARQFGKSAQQFVESNDGKLVRFAIGSSDEGSAIDQAARQKADVSGQTEQLQRELAKTRPGTQARANILSQIESLKGQVSQQDRAIEQSQAALAATPMAFHYYGQGGIPGFRDNPVKEAWHTFVGTIVWLIGILLQAAAVLVPLAILLAILIALWRTRPMRAVRHWLMGPEAVDA
jgi:hypothetical protein